MIRHGVGVLVVLGVICGLIWLMISLEPTYEKRWVGATAPIEQALVVKSMENKFIHIEGVGFGGAGAGGIGIPQIIVNSKHQFRIMVPKGETVYASVERGWVGGGAKANCTVKYWAFIENRAGLLEYSGKLTFDDPEIGIDVCYSYDFTNQLAWVRVEVD